MVLAIMALAVLGCLALLGFSARNATTICVMEIERGRLTMKRGAMAQRVVSDVADVVRKPKVKRAIVRVMRARDHARVVVEGEMSDAQRQQLRNVVGSVPLAKLVNARPR